MEDYKCHKHCHSDSYSFGIPSGLRPPALYSKKKPTQPDTAASCFLHRPQRSPGISCLRKTQIWSSQILGLSRQPNDLEAPSIGHCRKVSIGDGDSGLALWEKQVCEVHKSDGDGDDIQMEELEERAMFPISHTKIKHSGGRTSILYEPHLSVIDVRLCKVLSSGVQIVRDAESPTTSYKDSMVKCEVTHPPIQLASCLIMLVNNQENVILVIVQFHRMPNQVVHTKSLFRKEDLFTGTCLLMSRTEFYDPYLPLCTHSRAVDVSTSGLLQFQASNPLPHPPLEPEGAGQPGDEDLGKREDDESIELFLTASSPPEQGE
ncbi:hypothetical protein A6R68_04737, partial [Neotoma lepida]